jgi:hypothetical protein
MRYSVVKADTVDNLSDKINHLLSDYSHDVTFIGGPFPLREGWGQACINIKNDDTYIVYRDDGKPNVYCR